MRKALVAGLVGLGLLAGCGTTYEIPRAADLDIGMATQMFEDAQQNDSRKILSDYEAERRFSRVIRRVKPAGERVCEEATANREDFVCKVDIQIDTKMSVRNAYFTYIDGSPVIRMSMPLIKDTASDDEVAFVMSHEFGHLIGQHIEKQKKQALAGALILGAITAYGDAYAASTGQYYDPNGVARNMELGAAVGSKAYSQAYELESDTLAVYIAKAAGYNPVEGAKFFARPEDVRTRQGNLSFWGTHPPDKKRLATVIAAVKSFEASGGELKPK
ncbi:M48 family metalloprotease [Nereida ignava]|uniref:M48 family metalloprotease n=1 Tax=Nereida ignava TaxID=282199 RepID=UPI002FE2778C